MILIWAVYVAATAATAAATVNVQYLAVVYMNFDVWHGWLAALLRYMINVLNNVSLLFDRPKLLSSPRAGQVNRTNNW